MSSLLQLPGKQPVAAINGPSYLHAGQGMILGSNGLRYVFSSPWVTQWSRVDPPPQPRGRNTRSRREPPAARQPYVEPAARHDLGRMDRTCRKCGALHWFSERVQKTGSTIANPLFGMCCGDGTIRLPPLPPPPNELRCLFSASTEEAKQFRENIRQYNSALAFTSLGAQIDNSVNRGGGGPPVFRIQGELHHRIGVDNVLSMHNCTFLTPTRHATTGCSETVAWTLM